MENLLEKTERRPIPKTKYEIDQHGFIYNKGRRLRSQYKNGRWYCNIYKKGGRQFSVDTERLAELIFSDENPPELTRAMIEDQIKARQVPEYPRYSVTEYGAIYCMVPPKRGPNSGKMYLVSERTNESGKQYVVLYDYEGCRRHVQVQYIVDSVW
tara:strand:+ start:328 stop:792 length:465 start_codon:yes stop_codon:yes gene_type:complete